jgi:hypothetical protein
MTSLILPLSSQSNERLPSIVYDMVRYARVPVEHRDRIAEQYGAFLRGFMKDMMGAAFMPVTEITVEEMRYQHGDHILAEQPDFPNGYPIIGIYFNGLHVGITGILFDGKRVSVKQAETVTSLFLLKKAGTAT